MDDSAHSTLTIMSINPFDKDPELRGIMKELSKVTDPVEFQGWRRSFLRRYERFLGQTETNAAHRQYRALAKQVATLVKLLKRLQQLREQGALSAKSNSSVKAKTYLSELGQILMIINDKLEVIAPGTVQQDQKVGYTKFHLGAVLVRDDFSEYGRLRKASEMLIVFKDVLTGIVDRQVLAEMSRYQKKLQMFCDIMADLGLFDAMNMAREFSMDDEEIEMHESFMMSGSDLNASRTSDNWNSKSTDFDMPETIGEDFIDSQLSPPSTPKVLDKPKASPVPLEIEEAVARVLENVAMSPEQDEKDDASSKQSVSNDTVAEAPVKPPKKNTKTKNAKEETTPTKSPTKKKKKKTVEADDLPKSPTKSKKTKKVKEVTNEEVPPKSPAKKKMVKTKDAVKAPPLTKDKEGAVTKEEESDSESDMDVEERKKVLATIKDDDKHADPEAPEEKGWNNINSFYHNSGPSPFLFRKKKKSESEPVPPAVSSEESAESPSSSDQQLMKAQDPTEDETADDALMPRQRSPQPYGANADEKQIEEQVDELQLALVPVGSDSSGSDGREDATSRGDRSPQPYGMNRNAKAERIERPQAKAESKLQRLGKASKSTPAIAQQDLDSASSSSSSGFESSSDGSSDELECDQPSGRRSPQPYGMSKADEDADEELQLALIPSSGGAGRTGDNDKARGERSPQPYGMVSESKPRKSNSDKSAKPKSAGKSRKSQTKRSEEKTPQSKASKTKVKETEKHPSTSTAKVAPKQKGGTKGAVPEPPLSKEKAKEKTKAADKVSNDAGKKRATKKSTEKTRGVKPSASASSSPQEKNNTIAKQKSSKKTAASPVLDVSQGSEGENNSSSFARRSPQPYNMASTNDVAEHVGHAKPSKVIENASEASSLPESDDISNSNAVEETKPAKGKRGFLDRLQNRGKQERDDNDDSEERSDPEGQSQQCSAPDASPKKRSLLNKLKRNKDTSEPNLKTGEDSADTTAMGERAHSKHNRQPGDADNKHVRASQLSDTPDEAPKKRGLLNKLKRSKDSASDGNNDDGEATSSAPKAKEHDRQSDPTHPNEISQPDQRTYESDEPTKKRGLLHNLKRSKNSQSMNDENAKEGDEQDSEPKSGAESIDPLENSKNCDILEESPKKRGLFDKLKRNKDYIGRKDAGEDVSEDSIESGSAALDSNSPGKGFQPETTSSRPDHTDGLLPDEEVSRPDEMPKKRGFLNKLKRNKEPAENSELKEDSSPEDTSSPGAQLPESANKSTAPLENTDSDLRSTMPEEASKKRSLLDKLKHSKDSADDEKDDSQAPKAASREDENRTVQTDSAPTVEKSETLDATKKSGLLSKLKRSKDSVHGGVEKKEEPENVPESDSRALEGNGRPHNATEDVPPGERQTVPEESTKKRSLIDKLKRNRETSNEPVSKDNEPDDKSGEVAQPRESKRSPPDQTECAPPENSSGASDQSPKKRSLLNKLKRSKDSSEANPKAEEVPTDTMALFERVHSNHDRQPEDADNKHVRASQLSDTPDEAPKKRGLLNKLKRSKDSARDGNNDDGEATSSAPKAKEHDSQSDPTYPNEISQPDQRTYESDEPTKKRGLLHNLKRSKKPVYNEQDFESTPATQSGNNSNGPQEVAESSESDLQQSDTIGESPKKRSLLNKLKRKKDSIHGDEGKDNNEQRGVPMVDEDDSTAASQQKNEQDNSLQKRSLFDKLKRSKGTPDRANENRPDNAEGAKESPSETSNALGGRRSPQPYHMRSDPQKGSNSDEVCAESGESAPFKSIDDDEWDSHRRSPQPYQMRSINSDAEGDQPNRDPNNQSKEQRSSNNATSILPDEADSSIDIGRRSPQPYDMRNSPTVATKDDAHGGTRDGGRSPQPYRMQSEDDTKRAKEDTNDVHDDQDAYDRRSPQPYRMRATEEDNNTNPNKQRRSSQPSRTQDSNSPEKAAESTRQRGESHASKTELLQIKDQEYSTTSATSGDKPLQLTMTPHEECDDTESSNLLQLTMEPHTTDQSQKNLLQLAMEPHQSQPESSSLLQLATDPHTNQSQNDSYNLPQLTLTPHANQTDSDNMLQQPTMTPSADQPQTDSSNLLQLNVAPNEEPSQDVKSDEKVPPKVEKADSSQSTDKQEKTPSTPVKKKKKKAAKAEKSSAAAPPKKKKTAAAKTSAAATNTAISSSDNPEKSPAPKASTQNVNSTSKREKRPPPKKPAKVVEDDDSSSSKEEEEKVVNPVATYSEDELREKRKKSYMWFARMGQPSRKEMKRRVALLPEACDDITVHDVDLLPWTATGFSLHVSAMNKLITNPESLY